MCSTVALALLIGAPSRSSFCQERYFNTRKEWDILHHLNFYIWLKYQWLCISLHITFLLSSLHLWGLSLKSQVASTVPCYPVFPNVRNKTNAICLSCICAVEMHCSIVAYAKILGWKFSMSFFNRIGSAPLTRYWGSASRCTAAGRHCHPHTQSTKLTQIRLGSKRAAKKKTP